MLPALDAVHLPSQLLRLLILSGPTFHPYNFLRRLPICYLLHFLEYCELSRPTLRSGASSTELSPSQPMLAAYN